MKTTVHRDAVVGLVLAALVGQLGCAARPVPVTPDPPRPAVGSLGIASGRFAPAAGYASPARGGGEGAGRGAREVLGVVGEGWARGAQLGGPYGFALFLLAAPAVFGGAALAGAIKGAVEAPPAKEVEDAEAALKTALAEVRVQEPMRDHVAALAREWTRHRLVVLAEHGPASPGARADYGALAADGIDTVLEITVTRVDLERIGREQANPPLQLRVTVLARLVRAAEGAELYGRAFEYQGEPRKFTEWADDRARPLREELARVPEALGGRIVYELLCVAPAHAPCDHRDGGRG